MSYTKINPQPAQRASDAQGYQAPGLYPDEIALMLDDVQKPVAVYMESKWLDNNAGTEFYTSARAINADGSTLLCAAGQQVVTEFRHGVDPITLAQLGGAALTKEMVLAVLGEPATLHPETGPDASGNDVTTQQPNLNLPDEVRANVSIRHALAMAASAGPVTDLGALI